MTTITVIDLIKNLNNFDGTPGTLNRFLRNANRIITTAGENPATIEMVTDMVRNKIVGKANEILISVGDPSAWNLISEHLKTQFSDRRTVETILHKLNTISQNNKSLELYYSEISDLQTALLNSIDSSKTAEFISGQTEIYIMIALKSFIAGLDQKLGYIVRANRPTTIKDAYDICLNEISMQQSSNDRSRLSHKPLQSSTSYQPPRNSINNNRPLLQPPRFNYNNQNNNSHQLRQNSPMNNPLFRTQNNYNRPPVYAQQQYRPQTSNQPIFNRPPQQSNNNNQYRSTPMDVSSGNTKQVIHRQLNNQETDNVDNHDNYDDYEYEENYEDEIYNELPLEQDENFSKRASTYDPPDLSN